MGYCSCRYRRGVDFALTVAAFIELYRLWAGSGWEIFPASALKVRS